MEEGRGRLYSKGERLQRSESIQTNIAVECRGENIFLHHGIEAHGVREVEPVRGHFIPKGRHSRCTRLYRAYLDDLGSYPESQEEPAESVRRIARPNERKRVSATTPMENVGCPSCATTRDSHPSGIL